MNYTQTLLHGMMCIVRYGLKWIGLISTCTHTYVHVHATDMAAPDDMAQYCTYCASLR